MIPDLTNASPETREFYSLPDDIRSTISAIVGNHPRPMSTMEIMLAIWQAIAGERQRCTELPGDDEQ
ncbi:hypothetical protein GHK03_13880 [Sinorhizobium medicae]|uniref:hypothetical protein n=1 Tax=Sinorhizobium medicae TaxID=110321 RepID=UPI0012959428|nr:hypothetical protein [Sinorhizobium medicae]MQX97194.1 hypothetical protein [Sinorhizobium medicae]